MVAVLLAVAIFGTTFGASAPAAAAEPTWFEPGPAEPAPYNCLRGDLLVRSYLACDAGTRPPDLINPAYLEAGLAPGDQLYVADAAQRAALEIIQDQAIRNVMERHQLPSNDYEAVKSWARADVIAELWLLVYEAAHTSPDARTPVQVEVADWMLALLHRQALTMREHAALEYARWAGLDRRPLQALLDAPGRPPYDELVAALTGDPVPYSPFGGYCTYSPPGGGYEGWRDPTCAAPCTTPLGCPPPTPDSDSFLIWGANAALSEYLQTVDVVQSSVQALASLAYIGAVGGGAAIGVALSSALISLAENGGLWLSLVKAIVPFSVNYVNDFAIGASAVAAGEATKSASIAGGTLTAGTAAAVSAVLFAITTAITEGIELGETLERPSDMAKAVISLHDDPAFDLTALLGDTFHGQYIQDRLIQHMFWLLMGAVSPDPVLDTTCDNIAIYDIGDHISRPCLNAPPRHVSSADDPMFEVSRRDGQGAAQRSATITITNPGNDTVSTVALAGHWWTGTSAAANGSGRSWQSLRLRYTDWNGVDRAIWVVDQAGRTRFVEVDLGTEANPTNPPLTCTIECRLVDEIRYVGPGGVEYVARIAPPTPDTTPSTMTFFPVAARMTEALDAVTFTYSKAPAVSPTVELRRDGILLRRMTSADLQFLPADGRQWTFPLSGVDVGEQGQYTFTVLNQGVTDLQGNPFAGGNQSVTWYMDEAPHAEIDHNGNRLPAGDVPFMVRFSEQVHHVDITDFELLGDQQTFDLDAAGVVVQPIGTAGDEYRLSGFGGLLTRSGSYELRFAGGYDIVDVTANRSNRPSSTFEIAAPLTLTIDPVGARRSPVDAMVLRFSEPVTGFDVGDVTMWRDGSPVGLSGVVVVAQPGSTVFEVRGLHAATSVSGRYQLVVDPGGGSIVTDYGATLEMPVMSDAFDVALEPDPTTTLPEESTTSTTTTSTTTLPEESTTTSTTLPEESTTSTTTTSTTTTLPEESTTSSTTLPEESTTSTTTTSTTTTSSTTLPEATTTTTTTTTTTLPATTTMPTSPPRQPIGSPHEGGRPPVGAVVAPTQPTPPPAARPAPISTSPSTPVRRIEGPRPRATKPAGSAGRSEHSGPSVPPTPISMAATSTPATVGVETPTGSGNRTAIAAGVERNGVGVRSDTSSPLPIGAEWSALGAAIVAGLIGSWFAFRDRDRRPAARHGDVSS